MSRPRLHGRTTSVLHAAAALATVVIAACSSFAESSPPPVGEEAGVDGALPDASAPEADAATTCPSCPVELARVTDNPVANVVLTKTHVYWNTMESFSSGPADVYSCLKGTCGAGPTKLPKEPGASIVGLGSDGDQRAYGGAFYTFGGLFELGPSSLSRKFSTTIGGTPSQMSLRPNEMFYLSFYDPSGFGRTVHRWDYAGNNTIPCILPTTGEATAMAAFTTARAYLYANAQTRLLSCQLVSGTGQFTLYRPSVEVVSLTATADRVFWADGTGTVTSSPDGEMSPSIQIEIDPAKVGGKKVTSVTVSDGDLFATTAGGELWTCSPKDCPNTLRKLAAESLLETYHFFYSHTVAADADSVYYIAVDGTPDAGLRTSRLMKVARR